MPSTITKKDRAYQAIKHAIIAGELRPGEIYSITELSETFAVGRTPAREALVILASEGLIDPIPRSGYLVTPISIRDVLEVFHLRTVLEVEAVGLAVDRITEDDIRALEENNRREREVLAAQRANPSSQSYRAGYELNSEFHLTVARASGNLRLASLVEQLLNEMERILARDPYIADPQQHVGILNGLRRRDRPAAQNAMRQHLEDTKNRLLDRF